MSERSDEVEFKFCLLSSHNNKKNIYIWSDREKKQEVLERTNLPTFLTLFKNVICIKTSVCPNINLVGNSVPILKHSHIQNNVSNKRSHDLLLY
jgi:hypothetical protein